MKVKNLLWLSIYLLPLSSVLFFFKSGFNSFLWPSIDIFNLIERLENDSFVVNDFYTNASSKPNPRFVFAYFIIALKSLFSLNTYSAVHLFHIFLRFFQNVTYLTALLLILRRIKGELKIIHFFSLLFGLTFILHPKFWASFSIAWWSLENFLLPRADSLSVFVSFLAIISDEIHWKYSRISAFIFWFLSAMIHTPLSIFVFFWWQITKVKHFNAKRFFKELSPILISGLVCFFLFSAETTLSSAQFVSIYTIEEHSPHYYLPNFGSFTPLPWYVHFGCINILFLMLFFFQKRDSGIVVSKILFLNFIAFNLAVLSQYVSVNLLQLKLLAILGPVRFTSFAYLSLLLTASIKIESVFLKRKGFLILNRKVETLKSLKISFVALTLFSFCIILFISRRDDPYTEISSRFPRFSEWISLTNEQSVFASFKEDLVFHLPLVHKRAVFIGNGFPFNESYLEEYEIRKNLLFGDHESLQKIEGGWIEEKRDNFYHSLTPKDFVKISQRFALDYIILRNDKVNKSFIGIPSVFKNDKMTIYELKTLKTNVE